MYHSFGYIDTVARITECSMEEAVNEIKVKQEYIDQGGEVCIEECLYFILLYFEC